MLRGTDPAHKLAVNWQAGEVKLERERKKERGSRDERGKEEEEEGRVSACSREDENQRKEGGLSDSGSTTNTHPLLSLQSGLGKQEAACVSNRSNVCARVCVCIEFNAALESGRDVSH